MKIQLITLLFLLPLLSAHAEGPVNNLETRTVCEEAAKKFERIEVVKGHKPVKPGEFVELCEDVKKTASYWTCMNTQADQEIELNVAHTKCAKS